jgi:hypothetical protein
MAGTQPTMATPSACGPLCKAITTRAKIGRSTAMRGAAEGFSLR